jgi:predicted glycosyltransferase
MNIIFYCQYVWGMGHLVRSLEFARALSEHDVTLVAGGQDVALELPAHVDVVRLPALYMDERFTRLIPADAGRTVDQIKLQRKQILDALFEQKQPDVFIVELYPFGRSIFGFELEPLLGDIRAGKFGDVKTICSLRDILVEKKDPAAYEQRVLQKLNRNFDGLLIHSDQNLLRLNETFARIGDIDIPVAYTGFITQQADPDGGRRLRQDLNVSSDQKLIVASAGGGRSGYKLLMSVLDACDTLRQRLNFRLEVFSGPFMETVEFDKLAARAAPGIRIRRYTRHFLDYLQAADLSISLAGYNTCMNLLVSRVPALVHPYARQQEQPLRVDKIKNLTPMKIINEGDLKPDRLSKHMLDMLEHKSAFNAPPIDLNGAANAARILGRWAGADKAKINQT